MRLAPFQLFCVLGVCFQATLGMPRISTFDRKMALVQSREDFTTEAPFKCPGSGSYPVPGKECTGVYYSCATGSPVLTTCNGANSVFDPTTGSCMSASIAPCKTNTPSTSTLELSTTEETTEPIETTSPTTTTEKTTERTTTTSTTTPPTTTESTTERKTSTSTTTSSSTAESTTEKTTRTISTTTHPTTTESTTRTTSTTTPPTITESTTERKTSTSTTRSSTVPSGTTPIPFTCTADGSYPNPSNCNTFYMCSNGTPYIYNCPSNLVYNPVLQYCDYKANVPSCNNA